MPDRNPVRLRLGPQDGGRKSREYLNELESKQRLLWSTRDSYEKLTLVLAQVPTMLSECLPQVDPLYELPGDNWNSIFRLIKPILDRYLFRAMDKELIKSLNDERKVIQEKLGTLNEQKALLAKKRETLENHISRFSPEEGLLIKTKIATAQAELEKEIFYEEGTLERFNYKEKFFTTCLYFKLKLIVQSENSGIDVIRKVEKILRKDGKLRLRLKRETLNLLPLEISFLELKAQTIRNMNLPVTTWGRVKFSDGVPSVLYSGPSRGNVVIVPERPAPPLHLTSSTTPSVLAERPSRDRII